MLTGENHEVKKQIAPVGIDAKEDSQKISIVFSGTLVEVGQATGLVIATGMKSGIGRI